jgi:type VI secretion system protein ImpG
MRDELLTYYERELSFLQQMGAEFADKYPKIASRLLLQGEKCEDPHVERLIQAAAFLAARVHHKIDEEFPEITEALLNVLYPHYLNPIPSMAIVQFLPDAAQAKGYRIERGATLYSPPVGGQPCRFRTCYPVVLWPFEVAAADIEAPVTLGPVKAAAAIRLKLRLLGGAKAKELKLDQLRFFLEGEGQLGYTLYEILFQNVREVHLRVPGAGGPSAVVLRPESIRPVGFGVDEGMLPYPNRSFLPYRLLQEYFAFPHKYLFFDLCGLEGVSEAPFKDEIDLLFLLDRAPRLEQPVKAETFRLGCAPIINLFDQIAEPIRLNQTRSEYQVIPDVRRQTVTEVYSIEAVTSSTKGSPEVTEFQPFYSVRHRDVLARNVSNAYWYATRRPSQRKLDTGTEVYISLVDMSFKPTAPPVETLTIRTTSTNRDLPAKLPFGGGTQSDLQLEGGGPIARIRCLTKPTETLRPPLRSGAQWRLISHLSLNYLSIADGPDPLREILKLYDYSSSAVVQQQIEGILDVSSRRSVARPTSMLRPGFCRGVEVTVHFDEEKYIGSGVFLFASMLEKFLGLYATINSFVQLVATTKQREEPLKRWLPRAGEQILL